MRLIVFIICCCFMIQYNQTQESNTLFKCTFDNGFTDDCIFYSLTAENTTGDMNISTGGNWNFTLDNPPNLPLSDVTAISTIFTNDEMCQFPYQINGWDMYYCHPNESLSVFTCPTKSNDYGVCANGSYGYIMTVGWKGILERYTTREIYHVDINESQCLTFYYYMTNISREASIEVIWNANSSSDEFDYFIVEVYPQTDVKWYKSQTTFFVPVDNYTIDFDFYLQNDLSDTIPFYFAIDSISITRGACLDDNSTTDTTDALPIQESSTNKINQTNSSITTQPTTSLLTANNFGFVHELSVFLFIINIFILF